MARAAKSKERVKGGNVNLHPSTWEALRVRAFEERTTISEQVRRAVAEYLTVGQRVRRRARKPGTGGQAGAEGRR